MHLQYCLEGLRVLRSLHPELKVVYTLPDFSSILGFFASRNLRLKWIVDVWDHPLLPFYYYRNRGHIYKALLHWLIGRIVLSILPYADGIVCSILPDAFKGHVPDERIWDIPNGVDIKRVRSIAGLSEFPVNARCPKQFRVVYVGYVGRDRGIELILDIARQTWIDAGFEVTYTLVGPIIEHDKEWMQRKLQDLTLPNISTLGFLPWRDAIQIIASADACLFPFKSSPELDYIYPIKVLEYLALGKPVLSTKLKGVSRILRDNWNGFLLPGDEPAAWVGVLNHLRADRELYATIAANAWYTAERYDWQLIHGRLSNYLLQILGA